MSEKIKKELADAEAHLEQVKVEMYVTIGRIQALKAILEPEKTKEPEGTK